MVSICRATRVLRCRLQPAAAFLCLRVSSQCRPRDGLDTGARARISQPKLNALSLYYEHHKSNARADSSLFKDSDSLVASTLGAAIIYIDSRVLLWCKIINFVLDNY
jgi:hypothetical protein